jgi:hypothetical protein
MNAQLNHVLAVLRPLIVPLMLAVLAVSAPAVTADPIGQVTEFSTGTYPLPFQLRTTATSAAATVQPAAPPHQTPTPALSAPSITPRMFALARRRVGGRCQPLSGWDRRDRPCIRRVARTVRFTLSVGATVTFAIERRVPQKQTTFEIAR